MSERVSGAARVARGLLGVLVSGASRRGPFAGAETKALAELILSGGRARAAPPRVPREASPPSAASAFAPAGSRGAAAAEAASRESARERPSARPPSRAPVADPASSGATVVAPRATTDVRDDAARALATPPPSASPASDARDAPSERASSSSAARSSSSALPAPDAPDAPPERAPAARRHVAVPESPLARVVGFGRLGLGLAAGTVAESARRAWRGKRPNPKPNRGGGAEGLGDPSSDGDPSSALDSAPPPLLDETSAFLTEGNAALLADALCRMRGAALKLGQMLSIQDESVVPPAIARALERVREGADVMPPAQLHAAAAAHLGERWRDLVESFDETPMAAASIGQVHRATFRDPSTNELLDVCMKIQYPGVARSIHSDVDNLMRLVSLTDLLPRGLYAAHAAKVAKEELTLECDYEYERRSQEKMRRLLSDDPHWRVPRTVPELSGKGVLTTTFARGEAVDKVAKLSQAERDFVGAQLLRVTLRELFEFRFMQTDPNFANFLYDSPSGELTLIDFGAAKAYPKPFVDDYLRMVVACAERDEKGVIDASVALGFLTGEESPVLMDAHARAGFQVGLPFASEGAFDFARNREMTRRVAGLGKVMLKHRLTPPPEEAYSLHRKLSGCFLACMRIGARVRAREMLMEVKEKYAFGPEGGGGRRRRGRRGKPRREAETPRIGEHFISSATAENPAAPGAGARNI